MNNQITTLIGSNFPPNLKLLGLNGNQITNLQNVEFPQSLREIWLERNPISYQIDIPGIFIDYDR